MNRAVFFDRDGVLNECRGDRVDFVNSPDQLFLCPNVAEDIERVRQLGYKIYIVTNQGGVGAGHMSMETLNQIHEKLRTMIHVDDIKSCTCKPSDKCECRKPRPGMILSLAKKYNIDLSRSWMVGDMDTDVQAGQAAGCLTFQVKRNTGIREFVEHLSNKARIISDSQDFES